MKRIGIVGSRPPSREASQEEQDAFVEVLRQVRAFIHALPSGTVIVSGGAAGVDQTAVAIAKAAGLPYVEHLPRTADGADRFFARNQRIVDDGIEQLVAAVTVSARGTWDTVRRAKAKGIPVTILRAVR